MPVLIFLSLLLFIVSGIARVPGIMESPQFTNTLSEDFVKSVINEQPWLDWSYPLYFIIDYFWALILMLAICKFVRHNAFKDKNGKSTWLFYTFVIVVIGALLTDWIENYNYSVHYRYIKWLVNLKIGLYVIVLLTWFATLLDKYFSDYSSAILNFLQSAIISILILLVIGIFLPEAPQVNSIVVNLYNHPLNFFFLLLFAPIYAIVLAHYPSYFNIDEGNRKWYRAENFRFLLFGTIFYKYKEEYSVSTEGKKEGYVNFMFRTLGVIFYVALFYMIAYTSEVNFGWPLAMSKVAFSLLVIGIYQLYRLKNVKSKWLNDNFMYLYHHLPNFYDGDFISNEENKKRMKDYVDATQKKRDELYKIEPDTLYDIRRPLKKYAIFLLITLIAHGILFFFFS